MKRQVSKKTHMFVDNASDSNDPLSANWQGRVFVLDPKKSEIAKKLGYEHKGEYAIKVK